MRILLALACPTLLIACQIPLEVGSRLDDHEAEAIARAEKPLDVLVVFDNSGSMCEERERLIDAFFTAECPIQRVDEVRPEILNASGREMEELEQRCGFAQLLAAFDNDFRVGVITTDVGQCDNRYGLAAMPDMSCTGEAQPDWGRRPQRGCLQAPAAWERPFLTRGDADFADRFRQMLESAGEYGSPFERGLDAAHVFLNPEAEKAPGCEDHASQFIRPDARLLVLFVSDEDDCSHDDGRYGFPDETRDESCEHETERIPAMLEPPSSPEECYARPELLAPVSRYVEHFRSLKEDPADVSAFVLAGVRKGDDGVRGVSCLVDEDGAPGFACVPARGNGNHELWQQQCLEEEGLPCCEADGATRYAQLVEALGTNQTAAASICQTSFTPELVELCQMLVDPLDLR